MEDTDMINDEQLDHIFSRIVERQKKKEHLTVGLVREDKNWFIRVGIGHTISVLVLVAATLFGFGWSMNNRMTSVEINQTYTHDAVNEIRKTGEETRREVSDVKRDVQNLSSRLASTRRSFMTPAAEEPAQK